MASTLPCPIADEPTANGEAISDAGGIVLGSAPGIDCGLFQPKRSACATSPFAPTRTPSGANTELHEWANDCASVPPQLSPLAFSRSTPSITAFVATGNGVDGFASFARKAAAAVTILNVDPGGCGPENAMPASARTSPVRASIAATPP